MIIHKWRGEISMNLVEKLKEILPEDRISTNETVRINHSKDESFHSPILPDVVVFPKNKQEVAEIVRFANEYEISVVAFGAGSALEGQAIPLNGGITIDFQEMNQIIEIKPEDLLVQVQPGVTRKQLNKELGKHGLFFSVDPGADASLGGMASTNASGTTTVRYGAMKDNVRDLEVVLADGRVIHTGSKAKKSSSGYRLTELFVGSEGTLGIFTELTLQVYGISEAIVAGRAIFPSVKNAVQAAISLISAGIPIARIELVDAESMKSMNACAGTDFVEDTTLFLEFHGSNQSVEGEIKFTEEVFADFGCYQIEFEADSAGRSRLWEVRHNHLYYMLQNNPGKKKMITDVCVPLSKLAEAIEFSRKCIEESGLKGTVIGHIGDGNFHAGLLIDPNNPNDMEKANQFNERIVHFALSHEGTCTGEHGVGLGKMKYQRRQHGEALDAMLTIKQALDPKNILNPGKIFP
jgi:D-lactate dehydrogenase (cytochrome)